MKYLYVLVCLAAPMLGMAQFNHDFVWLLGSWGDPVNQHPNQGLNIFDFNGGELNVTREYLNGNINGAAASICSSEGILHFYTNGCRIYNNQGQVMENGSNINPGAAYQTNNCPDIGYPSVKSLIILPMAGDINKFYMFHQAVEISGGFILVTKLYYTLVDMSANNGLGKVLDKNITVIADTLHGDLHAVRHANGEDWWVLCSKATDNIIWKILLTEDGVAGVDEQQIGPLPDPFRSTGGMSSFSPDGAKYARFYLNEQVSLFDFDRETGGLSNYINFFADSTGGSFTGISFSPNSRYLYSSTQTTLFQFDLWATDILASRTLVGEFDGYLWNGQLPTTFGRMQLAPDCRIYLPTRNGSDFLHVIHHPDRPGTECQFEQRAIQLQATNASSIPNFPNYRLGTPYPVCDSTIQLVTGSVGVLPVEREVRVFPNPASGGVTVSLPDGLRGEGAWSLHAPTGQAVRHAVLPAGQAVHSVSVEGLSPGLYFWEVRAAGQRLGSGKLVVAR